MSIIFNIVTAFATVVIAIVAYSNYRLSKSLSAKSEKHEQEMRDFLLATVLAHLLRATGAEDHQKGVQRFKYAYKGKTPITFN